MTNSIFTRLPVQLAIAAAISLSACGGGGSSTLSSPVSPTGTTAEGAYMGTLTGSNSSAFDLLVLEDGSYWALYGNRASNILYVNGFVQGQGSSIDGAFTSNSGRDLGVMPSIPAVVSATYTAAPSVSGSFVEGTNTVQFAGGAVTGSGYNYSTPAVLSEVTGIWNFQLQDGETAAANISNAGAIGAISSGGCQFSGTIEPRTSGKNVFNVTLNFGAAPCVLAGKNVTGVAIYAPSAAGSNELIVAVVDSTRNYGMYGFGTR